MTLKSLFNWGSSGGYAKGPYVHLERWQSGWEHPHHSHGHSHGHHGGGGGKGGSGAALSALALLAFLFFINCMQQSLNDTSMPASTTTTTALLVRDDEDLISNGVERKEKFVKAKQGSLTAPINKRSELEKGDVETQLNQYY